MASEFQLWHLPGISSSIVRQHLASNESIRYLVHDKARLPAIVSSLEISREDTIDHASLAVTLAMVADEVLLRF